MKATGVVRRIDDLGRVVIPKEIRKSYRIPNGAPLEIFLSHDQILLKKYEPFKTLEPYAQDYANSLDEALGLTILITDDEKIIAASKGNKKKFIGKKVTPNFWDEVVENQYKKQSDIKYNHIFQGVEGETSVLQFATIKTHDETRGAIIALSEQTETGNETEEVLLKISATILGNMLK